MDRRFLENATGAGAFHMSFEVFKQCIERVPASVDIHFTGMCEPWLNPWCTQMLLHAHARGHRIAASTTLVGMTLLDIDALADIPFKMFWVHLPSSEGYEAIRVDQAYLELLKRIIASSIPARYHFHGQAPHPGIKGVSAKVHRLLLSSRSGNAQVNHSTDSQRRNQGGITCARNLRCNVLLPNGDVVLCCNDYGMQHVLGNLMVDDYEALHRSAEFRRIERGLLDSSLEILCRYCDVDVVENREGFTNAA